MIPGIPKILNRQNQRVDAAVSRFEARVGVIEGKVRGRVLALLKDLEMSDAGRVMDTPENRGLIRESMRLVMRSMTVNGYSAAVRDFLDEFSIQRETVDAIFRELGVPIVWNRQDLLLEHQMVGATHQELMGLVEGASARLAQRVRTAVGVADFGEVADLVDGALGTTQGEARTIADTGINAYFRKLNNKKNAEAEITKFYYAGPNDILTRPFCGELISEGRVFTAEEIAGMDNEQDLDVMTFGGGYNCRHQWIGIPQ